MPYTHLNLTEKGFPNTVNALAAVASVVYDEGRATLGELADALERDFAGTEPLRLALRAAPKWGTGDRRAESWAHTWVALRERARLAVAAVRGEPRLVSHLTRSLHHVLGRALGATADGRHAGEPYADSIGPETGTSAGGPTVSLTAATRLDAPTAWNAGYNLNVTLPPLGGDTAPLRALIEGFFAAGGQELQVNVLHVDTLREAQSHPEAYPDLLVRVAGLCARFIDLSPAHQDELIARASVAR